MYNRETHLPQEDFNRLWPYATPILKACRVPQEAIDSIAYYNINRFSEEHLSRQVVYAHIGGWVGKAPTQLHIGHVASSYHGDVTAALAFLFPLWEIEDRDHPGKKIWDGVHVFLSENMNNFIAGPLAKSPVAVDCRVSHHQFSLPYTKDKDLALIPKWMTSIPEAAMPILACLFDVTYPGPMLGEEIPGE